MMVASVDDFALLEPDSGEARSAIPATRSYSGDKRNTMMRIEWNHISPLLVIGAAAAVFATAPTAAAAIVQSCITLGAKATQCQSPGNVQINDAPTVQYQTQYPYLGGLGVYHHGHRHR
jgi:hypothetical protein